jgi:hypothetical protein
MSKRKFSLINFIESEDTSYIKGQTDGENIAKILKKEPTFNFKSYLDGLCHGYTLECKSLKEPDNISFNIFSFESKPLINKVTLQTYINHEIASYNKGSKDGKTLAKNNDIHFLNFKSYLDGISNSYTSYENTKISKSFSLFNFSFNNSDCVFRSINSPPDTSKSDSIISNIESEDEL